MLCSVQGTCLFVPYEMQCCAEIPALVPVWVSPETVTKQPFSGPSAALCLHKCTPCLLDTSDLRKPYASELTLWTSSGPYIQRESVTVISTPQFQWSKGWRLVLSISQTHASEASLALFDQTDKSWPQGFEKNSLEVRLLLQQSLWGFFLCVFCWVFFKSKAYWVIRRASLVSSFSLATQWRKRWLTGTTQW